VPSTPLPIIENGYRVAHNYHSGDATFTNVFWLTADPSATEQDVADTFQLWYFDTSAGPTIASLQSQDLTFDSTEVTKLDGVTPTLVAPYTTVQHGLVLSQMAAANASFIISWETGVRGRSNRGRTFFAGGPSASLETGSARWSSAFLSDMNSWIPTWLSNMAAATFPLFLMVVSQHSELGPHHNPVTGFVARQGIGTQRRRTEREKP
jgi:hypothetical protein